jgi:hypothetical protein
MGTRGRRSTAELVAIPAGMPSRPEPPPDLGAEAAEEWRAIVARMPVDWFTREVHPLLAAFCGHVVRARVLSGELDALGEAALRTPDGVRQFDQLAKMAERETRAMATLGVKMRLTQQSRFTPGRAGTAARASGRGSRPWEGAV